MSKIYLVKAVDKEIYNRAIEKGVKTEDIEYAVITRTLWATKEKADALKDCQTCSEKHDRHKYYIQEIDLY